MSRGAAAYASVLVALVAGACTGGSEPAADSDATTRAPRSSTDATADGRGAPLALVVHPSRDVTDVRTADARNLVADGPTRWSRIGLRGGRMSVVAAPSVTDAAEVRAVASAQDAIGVVRADPGSLALVPASAVDTSVRALPVGGVDPLRAPAAYPLRTDVGDAPESVTTVTVVGDIMLGRRVGERMAAVDDPAAVFRPLAIRLSAADVTVGNLESSLSKAGAPTQGGDSFAADPSVERGLRLAGFDVLDLANNHLGDYGQRALRRTLTRVDGMGIESVGAGVDRAAARTPAIVEVDGVRIGFYATDSIGETPAASARTPGTNRLDMPPRTGPLDRAALRDITSDIRRLDRRVDAVIAMPHWGTQYTHVPEPSQRRVAAALVRAGADVVAGGHPHWVQPLERTGDSAVAYSLGNFVFDMDFSRETQEGVFLEIVLWDGDVVGVNPVPYVIGPDFAPRRVSGERAQGILDELASG
ncbi:CapA family protein [Solicola gregarius]|uniref:CapA family protein n=1 Tax=Solicola gregarius TaxID=2908642 RepID=A0AA46TFV9_9ACTN|nr:CapA family protein [Solicola gregarius]UYM04561.1 CapA family protein [Solicola gregarius]